MKRSLLMTAALLCLAVTLAACGYFAVPPAGQQLTAAQIQQNRDSAFYLLRTVGCTTEAVAGAAAPIVAIAADAKGNQVLTAASSSGTGLCTLTVPPGALPAPLPPSSEPVTVSPPAPSG